MMLNPPTMTDSEAALADLVRRCRGQGVAVVDYGTAHQGLGNPPPAEHVHLRQQGDVLEHYDRDLTVRAAAGCTLGRLREVLTPTGQFCAIDADDDLSIGEVIAHHLYGPLRMRYGSVRDQLLGLAYIDAEGRRIAVGGRTVKNVAGYDMTRFMVGSLNQIGALSEATLRTYSIPQMGRRVTLVAQNPAAIDQRVTGWMVGTANPAGLLLRRDGWRWVLDVIYLGNEQSCDVQSQALDKAAESAADLSVQQSNDSNLAGIQAHLAGVRSWRRRCAAVVKVIVPPGVTCQTALRLAELGATEVEALPGHGCLFAGGDLAANHVRTLDESLLAYLTSCGGMRLWIARPEGAHDVAPAAPVQPEWSMLGRLQRALDPTALFNPGRLLPTEGV